MNSNPNSTNNFFLLYYFRQTFPQNQSFHIFHFLLRSIGLVLCTCDISKNERSNISIKSLLNQITFANIHNITFRTYFIISLVIFSFYLLLLLCVIAIYSFLIYFSNKNYSVFVYQCSTHSFSMPIRLKICLKIVSNLLIVTSVLNQHLLDFLFFGVMNLYYAPNLQHLPNINTKLIQNFNSASNPNSYIHLGIINVITSVIILLLNFLLNYLSNSKSLCCNLGTINYSENLISNSIYVYFSFLQAIYSTINIYNDDYQKTALLGVTISIFVLLLLNELMMWNAFVFITQFELIKRYVHLFCLISGVTECVLFFVINKPMTQKESMTKLVLIFLLTLIVLMSICFLKYHLYESHLVLNLFNDTKSTQYDSLLYLFCKLRNILNGNTDEALISLYLMLQKHKRICNKEHCPCTEVDISSINELIAEKRDRDKKKEVIFTNFVIILEHEVLFSLNKLRSSFDDLSKQQSLVFLHLDIITLLRNNYKIAYYYAGIYASAEKKNKMSPMLLYYLHELKFYFLKTLLKAYIEEKKVITTFQFSSEYSPSGNLHSFKQYRHTKKLKEKYEYLVSQEIIKGLMIKCIESILKVINYKKYGIHLKNSNAKCENLMSLLSEYKEMNRILKDICESFCSMYKLTQMKQLAYLLYHYFTMMNIHIPFYMNHCISSIAHHSNDSIDDISFEEIKMTNPIIARMKFNDSFEINYVSQTICDILLYRKSELINNDINILLPRIFAKTHQMYLKLFVLFGNEKYLKDSYMKTKKDTLVHCHLICKSLPSYSEFYLLLVNVHFIPSVSSKKINYHVIVDSEFQFLYSNTEFYDHFFLTYSMVSMLQIDLMNLFCLAKDQFAFKSNRAKGIYKGQENDKGNDKGRDNNIEHDFNEEIKAIGAFTLIHSNNFLKYRNYNYFTKKLTKKQDIIKTATVSKESLFNPIDKIIQNISEMNLDYEYLTRMTSLQERIRQSMTKEYPIVVNNLNINTNSNSIYNKYNITLTYKSLGNFPYCVVLIEEDNINPSYLIQMIKKFKASTDVDLHYNINKTMSMKDIIKMPQNRLNTKEHIASNNSSANANFNNNGFINSSLRITSMNSTSSKRDIVTHNKTSDSSISNTKQSSTLLLKSTENISSLIDHNLVKRPHFKTIFPNEKESPPLVQSKNNRYNSPTLINCIQKTFLGLLVVLIALNLYHLIEDSKQMNISRYIALINNNSFLLKGQMIFSSLFFIRTCCIIDGIIKEDFNKMDKLKHNANSLMNLLVSIETGINNCDIDEVKALYQILIEETNYKQIDIRTFSIIDSQSSLFDHIISMHYYFSKLYYANDFQSCGMLDYFKRNNKEVNKAINLEQLLLPYLLYNSYGGIMEQLNKLTKRTYQILYEYHNNIKGNVGLVNGLILIIDFFCLILFITLIELNSKCIKRFLIYFMTYAIEDNRISEKLNTLKQLASEFNLSALKSFQNLIKNIEPPMVISQKKGILITNAKKKNSILKKDKNIFSPELSNNDFQLNKSNLKLFKPRFIVIGIIIIIVIYICLLGFQAFNIYINVNLFDQILQLNSINSNFIQRIPALQQLALYYMISISLNNHNLVLKTLSKYESSLFFNFYSVTIEHENDSFYDQVGDSYYAYLNYQLNVIRENVKRLINDKKRRANFKIVLDIESTVNEKNNFPIYSALGYNYVNPNSCSSVIECFEKQNKLLQQFMLPGNGMNANGLNIVLDTTIQLFNQYYLCFINDANGNAVKYLNEKDIEQSIMNVLDIFQVFDSYMNTLIVSDVNEAYDQMKRTKIYFSVVSIIFNVLLANLCYWLVVKKIEKDKRLLLTVGQDVLLIITGSKRIESNCIC